MNAMNSSDDAMRRRLSALPHVKQVAFALLVCERMMLALQAFAQDTDFEINRYRSCLQLAWEYLGGSREKDRYEPACRGCLEEAPDTENFTHPLTSDALNAALSISELMCFLADHDVQHVWEVVRFAQDTAAMRVQATQPIALELDDVMKHDTVQAEIGRQERELSFAESLPDNSGEVVRLIRERLPTHTDDT
jgi:uncharacterized protein